MLVYTGTLEIGWNDAMVNYKTTNLLMGNRDHLEGRVLNFCFYSLFLHLFYMIYGQGGRFILGGACMPGFCFSHACDNLFYIFSKVPHPSLTIWACKQMRSPRLGNCLLGGKDM